MTKIHNFSAGPSILPPEVFKEASDAILEFQNTGLSVLEMSHRSKEIEGVIEEATKRVKDLLKLPGNYSPIFLTGGASSQFFMAPMNFLDNNKSAAYIDTGKWSDKAIKEAGQYGTINVVASAKDKNYTYIPKEYKIPEESIYLHLTNNNTIYGTQYHNLPETDVPLVSDMSSEIFSKPIENIHRYGMIYAGAQKNMGPAGVTLVIVRDDMLGNIERKIPTILDYRTHIKKNSAFNTPPVYAIYISLLVLRWIENKGGLEAIQNRNTKKANALYKEIDRNSLFKGVVAKEDRSQMNITFNINDKSLENEFLKYAQEHHISGIKGHRSVGGFRASIYNAMPMESVEHLINVLKEFESKN